MSTLAARLAAALEPLSADAKATLVKLLRAQIGTKPAAPKAPRQSAKDSLLLDTRTVAELWLAGESADARNRAERAQNKAGGEYRSILVTFADGFSVRTGSYMARDDYAKAAAVRVARGRAMEREFAARRNAWLAECATLAERNRAAGVYDWQAPSEPNAWQWVRLPDASTRRTRACAVADVVAVEFVRAEPAAGSVQLGNKLVIAAGPFSPVDHAELARRAKALRAGVAAYPLPMLLAA